MSNNINKAVLILVIITLGYTIRLTANELLCAKQHLNFSAPQKTLPAKLIIGEYISPDNGINISDARKIIISKLKNDGIKGDINSSIKLTEITTKDVWDNVGVQLYRVIVDYAWLNGIAIVKNREVLAILPGMPTEAVFIADLDNDNIYEIYTNILFGSGIISEEIQGYNVALNEHYGLSFRMKQDIHLYVSNEILMAEIRPYRVTDTTTFKRTGKVILRDNNNRKVLSIE